MKYIVESVAIGIIILFSAILALTGVVVPSGGGGGRWTGADSRAADAVLSTGYIPWFTPVWEPPSGEIETLFFTLQAVGGSLVIGYFFGYYRGRGRGSP